MEVYPVDKQTRNEPHGNQKAILALAGSLPKEDADEIPQMISEWDLNQS